MKAPTDLELMMYADGELGEERSREIAQFLGDSSPNDESGAKLFGLHAVGEVVRDQASRVATLHAADGIAALVMSSLDDEEEAGVEKPVGERSIAEKSAAKTSVAGSDRTGRAASTRRTATNQPSPANDNNRLIYMLAGLAAAAAVVIGFWGRTAPQPEANGHEPVVREVPPPSPTAPLVLSSLPVEAVQDSSAHPESDDERSAEAASADEASVKVAAVDFGAKAGTVYYVPKDTPGATTAVVWLADQ